MTKLEPGSPEWAKTITASKIPAILGISRWTSQFAMWHQMAGNTTEVISEPRQDNFDYGHAVEVAAAEYWKYRNPGWRISRGEIQFSRADLPFPNAATIDRRGSRGSRRRIVEVKTARSLEEWGDDGTGNVPADYTAQVIWQQFIAGWHVAADLVLWPQYGMPRIYTVEYDSQIAAVIVDRALAWHKSLEAGEPPELDDTVATYETVKQLHPDIDGSSVELDPDLAHRFIDWHQEQKQTNASVTGMKSKVLDAMGSAQYAMCNGQKIADRRPGRGGSVSLYANTKLDLATIKEIAS
ncbi:YqaJ viral recombinase family protein [Rhodococcus sp. IEGM 1330]|uniref:YqaJ viral recombinase family protein n=1 Tax=Rhodococcus sp. IEGM 1330 TaxID=3082225 RepID=UPI00295297A3|nr:YqaJ viral recombinase family protein [Rhodococcus sp. IEGM 1330]MDV8022307.1 YqaJ viral recombinase family protein [Rhodococcus sp. IEGM 1330]